MIELISLKFGNIRSFIDDQHITFQGRDKLVQIDGRNENTGGSSGAGKTTILMALDYLLGIGDVPSTVLQSRLTKDGIWASGEFLVDNEPISISRSKKDGLVIKMSTETISGNAKLAEEKLNELIGLPIKIFKKMIHKKQKEGGFFLNMTPKETYEFLISVLGLEKYISNIDIIAAEITSYSSKIDLLQKEVQLNEASLLDMERVLSEKKKPDCAVSDEEIEKLNLNISRLRANTSSLKMEIKIMIDDVSKPVSIVADTSAFNSKIAALVPARVALNDKLETVENSKDVIKNQLDIIANLIPTLQKTGEKILSLKKEKEHIENSQCPTCMQTWTGEGAIKKVAALDSDIKLNISVAKEYKTCIDSKGEYEEKLARIIKIQESIKIELNALQDQRAVLDAEKYKLMESISSQNYEQKIAYDSKIVAIENKMRAAINTLNEEQSQAELQLSTKESQKRSFLVSMAQYEKETASINSVISRKKNEMDSANAELQSLKKKTIVAEESKRLIKAYVLQTFQETLDAIGEVATNILTAIPNMATSTVYFEGCKETKSGSIKDEVVAILNMDGNNEIPIKSLSGGERTAVDLAIDLAVIDVIETKASKGANFLFMDEPFDGLDSVCKENCLEILKQIDTNKKIIMVDHSSELKEMVSDVILVIKKGETSTIAV